MSKSTGTYTDDVGGVLATNRPKQGCMSYTNIKGVQFFLNALFFPFYFYGSKKSVIGKTSKLGSIEKTVQKCKVL